MLNIERPRAHQSSITFFLYTLYDLKICIWEVQMKWQHFNCNNNHTNYLSPALTSQPKTQILTLPIYYSSFEWCMITQSKMPDSNSYFWHLSAIDSLISETSQLKKLWNLKIRAKIFRNKQLFLNKMGKTMPIVKWSTALKFWKQLLLSSSLRWLVRYHSKLM